MSLNSKQLREVVDPDPRTLELVRQKRVKMQWILHDIVDTYNVGSIFRLADAMGVEKLWLCGKTECPPNHRIEKASVGTHKWVDWSYAKDSIYVMGEIRKKNSDMKIVAVEQARESVGLGAVELNLPVAVVVGNETEGLSSEVLNEVDTIIEMPMHGINKSLNVAVSLAMVMARVKDLVE